MNIHEHDQEIRNHFNTFTVEEIANSTYFNGIDFNTESIESIMSYLNALFENVKTLSEMIDRNFKQKNDEHVLLPRDHNTQEIIGRDYYEKSAVLSKALSNKYVYDRFIRYRKNEENNSNRLSK